MFVRIMLACLLGAAPLVAQQEEKPKPVPKDSLRVVVTGCVKGRVIRAADVRQPDTTSGLPITSKTFRLEGSKDVMKGVKGVDGGRAEITGLIKKSALIEPGMSVAGGRVRVGSGNNGTAGSSTGIPSPAENVLVLDAESVQAIAGSCGN